MNVSVGSSRLAGQGKLWQMAPQSLTATNTVGKPDEVTVTEQALGPLKPGVSLPPFSVSIYSYAIQ